MTTTRNPETATNPPAEARRRYEEAIAHGATHTDAINFAGTYVEPRCVR